MVNTESIMTLDLTDRDQTRWPEKAWCTVYFSYFGSALF